jgi:hypothetical protein
MSSGLRQPIYDDFLLKIKKNQENILGRNGDTPIKFLKGNEIRKEN